MVNVGYAFRGDLIDELYFHCNQNNIWILDTIRALIQLLLSDNHC